MLALDRVILELEQRAALLRPARDELVRLEAALEALHALNPSPMRPASPTRPTSHPRPRAPRTAPVTLERARDAAQALGSFTTTELMAHLAASRPTTGRLIRELRGHGTVELEGTVDRGPGVRWRFVKPAASNGGPPASSNGSAPRVPGWQAPAIPGTGRPPGPSDKPGDAGRSRRIKRASVVVA